MNLSERAACIKADVGLNTIRHIRVRGHAPKIDNLRKLEAALEAPHNYFVEAATRDEATQPASKFPVIETAYVKGAVQAGVWKESMEWPPSEWTQVFYPVDGRFPGIERIGLLVQGNSMNRVYPSGSVVIVVRFSDIARLPANGERVIVLRRCQTSSEYEATVKRFTSDEGGRIILWPESTEPEFQQPIIIDDPNQYNSDTEYGDIVIFGLVIGSYRVEN